MRYLVSAAEMREYDRNTIERIGIPACVLMERAALAAVEIIEEHCAGYGGAGHVLVMAGMGNNGGDGLAVARLLVVHIQRNEQSQKLRCGHCQP